MPAKSDKSAVSYRELSTQLDETLSRLQEPELDIDEAAKVYEKGLKLVAQLEKHLQQAENKIQAIRAQDGSAPAAK
jgi:exodeoxyribonuclease VII small subunit